MYNFVEILSDSVKVGQKFVISGVSTSEAEHVSITFSSEDNLTVLSIDLNFTSNKVIYNKGDENDVALNRGGKFELIINIDSDSSKISYNGDFLSESKYQMSLDKIHSVAIRGDVDKLKKVNHLDAEYPIIAVYDGNLAFESYIPVRYKPGHVTVVSGSCYDEFFFMFTKNDSNRQLIHFNPRFDEEVVVMNTEDDVDCWTENEERSTDFPFGIEKPFNIVFAFTEDALKIAVNGNALMNFNFDRIYWEEGETLWAILTGFRIVNRNEDAGAVITSVKHIQMDSLCEGFEQHSNI